MSEQKVRDRKERNRLVIAALAALVATSAPVFMLANVGSAFARVNDLPEYYAAARMVWEGRFAEIYDPARLIQEELRLFPSLGERGIVLFIPPFSFVLLVPLGLIPAEQVAAVWTGFLVVLCLASVWILRKVFRLDTPKTLWLYALMCVAAPVYEGIRIGQLAPVMLASFSAALLLLLRGRAVWSGVALSGLLLKPPELLPIWVFLAAAGCRRAALSIIAVFVGLLAVSCSLPGGAGSYKGYVALLGRSSENLTVMQPELSATLRGQLLRLGVLPAAADMASCAVLFLVLSLIAASGWRVARLKGIPVADRVRCMVSGILMVAVPLGLVSALHCHDYDLVLMIPVMVALLSGWLPRVPVAVTGICICGMVAFIIPIYIDIHYGYLMSGGSVNPGFLAMMAISTALATTWWRNLPVTGSDSGLAVKGHIEEAAS